MIPNRLLGIAGACALLAAARHAAEPLLELRELAVPAAAGAGEQNLAVAPDGRVFLSWIEPQPDSSHALRFSVLGGEWSRPRTVAQGRDWFVNWADFPSLAALPGDGLVAHWLQKSGRGPYAYDVRLTRSADGGATWSAPVVPHRDATPTEHGFATLIPEPSGAVTAVWVDGRATAGIPEDDTTGRRAMNLRAATWDRSGALGPEVQLDDRVCDCCQTAAALAEAGPVVVYRDRTADEIRDIAIVRRVNGAWTAPAVVAADDWRINACPVNGPAVAAQGRRVWVAWYTGAGGVRRVKAAASFDGGASFGAPVVVDDGRPAGRVGIILADDGALVSWLEDTPGGAEVRVRLVAATGRRGPSQTVARTAAGRPSGFPRMVRSGDRVVLAWREPGAAARVRSAVARLAPPGAATGR